MDCDKISDRNGKDYLEETGELFTGTCVSYHENGKISFRGTMKNGETHGKCEWWFENGTKREEIVYESVDGFSRPVGEYLKWFDNRQLKSKMYYNNGKREGEWVEYDSSGNVTKKGVYKNGIHISGDQVIKILK